MKIFKIEKEGVSYYQEAQDKESIDNKFFIDNKSDIEEVSSQEEIDRIMGLINYAPQDSN